MVFKFTNPSIQYITKHFYKDIKTIINFEKLCNEFQIFLDNLPKEFDIDAISLEEYQKLLIIDYKKANYQLVREANQNIQFIWILSSFKTYKLFNSILEMFNKGDFYSSMHLIRGLVETICSTHYFLNKVKPLVEKLNNSTNDWNKFNLINQELEFIINTAKKGTRMEIMIKESNDSARAKSSMNYIYCLLKNDKFKEIPKFYEILCEYVHPNNFSNTIFGIVTKLYKENPSRLFKENKIKLISGEMDKYYRDMPKKYSPMITTYYGMLVKVITLCINLFKETVKDYKKIKVKQLDGKPSFSDSFQFLSEEEKNEILKKANEDVKKFKEDRLKKKS